MFARPKLKSRRINNVNLKLLGKNYWSNLVESATDERPDKPVLALTRRKLSRWLSLLVIVLGAARELFQSTLFWFQLEDMFQLIVTPPGIEKVTLKDTPTKVYAIGAKLFLSKVPLEVLQN